MLFPCRVADTVLSAFIGDISARFPLVCGQIVSFIPASVPSTSLSCVAVCDHTSSSVRSLQSQKNGPDENTQHAMMVNTFNPAVTCDT